MDVWPYFVKAFVHYEYFAAQAEHGYEKINKRFHLIAWVSLTIAGGRMGTVPNTSVRMGTPSEIQFFFISFRRRFAANL